jgi:hypothetical protein
MSGDEPDVRADRFRVLALDGGGVRGAFTASVQAELENSTGTRCEERFDLITGTSTGGESAGRTRKGDICRWRGVGVGTTSPVPDFSDEIRSGLIGWGPRMASLLTTAQAQASVAIAQVLCRNRFHRINAEVPNDWIAMDSTKSVDKLISAGRVEARKDANNRVVSETFLNDIPVKPFVAVGASS